MKINPVNFTIKPHPNAEWRLQHQRLIQMIIAENDEMKPQHVSAWLDKLLPGHEPLTHLNWHRLVAMGAKAAADREFQKDLQWTIDAASELKGEFEAEKMRILVCVSEDLREPLIAMVTEIVGASYAPFIAMLRTAALYFPARREESSSLRSLPGDEGKSIQVITTE